MVVSYLLLAACAGGARDGVSALDARGDAAWDGGTRAVDADAYGPSQDTIRPADITDGRSRAPDEGAPGDSWSEVAPADTSFAEASEIAEAGDIADVADVADIADIADIADVADVADVAGVIDVTDVTDATDLAETTAPPPADADTSDATSADDAPHDGGGEPPDDVDAGLDPTCVYGAGVCQAGVFLACAGADTVATDCHEDLPCVAGACVAGVGCTYVADDAAPCDDGDPCTVGDACGGGACLPGAGLLDCDDGDPCTSEHCVPAAGCSYQAASGPCEDGDACTVGDTCQGGVCAAGTDTLDCDDLNPCTADACDAIGGCVHEPQAGPCEDDNPCTVGDLCKGGACAPGPGILACDDGDPCTLDLCDITVGCFFPAADGPCDDDDPCTEGDACVGGVCVGVPVDCGAGAECSAGACVCTTPCLDVECGADACGMPCGVCGDGQICQGGLCMSAYPPSPWGPFLGDTAPDLAFVDPETEGPISFGDFHGDGRALLVTFTAGWCVVCQKDAAKLNAWLADYHDDGLRILEVLYETSVGLPPTPAYGKLWKSSLGITYPLGIDAPTYQPSLGNSTGGALGTFHQPDGPLKWGTFPATLVLCPQTMEILYITTGFYKDEVLPLIEGYLFATDCW